MREDLIPILCIKLKFTLNKNGFLIYIILIHDLLINHVEILDQGHLARISVRERPALLGLEEAFALVESPLKMDTSGPVSFRASLIHLETVELDTFTYS